MQALHDVVQAGYVRYIGMSSCWAWQCMWFLCVEIAIIVLNVLPFIPCTVHAMQSKPTPFAHYMFMIVTVLVFFY